MSTCGWANRRYLSENHGLLDCCALVYGFTYALAPHRRAQHPNLTRYQERNPFGTSTYQHQARLPYPTRLITHSSPPESIHPHSKRPHVHHSLHGRLTPPGRHNGRLIHVHLAILVIVLGRLPELKPPLIMRRCLVLFLCLSPSLLLLLLVRIIVRILVGSETRVSQHGHVRVPEPALAP